MELTIEDALQRGWKAQSEGNLKDAERLYRAILEAKPFHPDANHNLGMIAVSVGKADSALPLFEVALEANPKVEQFWISYIDALVRSNRVKEAKRVVKKAKKTGINDKKLKKLLSQTADIIHSNSPSPDHLNILLEQYQSGRLNEAEELATTISRKFPNHEFAWKVLGAIFAQTGRKDEAANAYEILVELCPNEAEAHNNLGNIRQELGRLQLALSDFRQAIALNSSYPEAIYGLGVVYQKLGRLQEAQSSYTQVIALKPDYFPAHNNLGMTLQNLGRLQEAEASYIRAIEINPQIPEVKSNLVRLLTTHNSDRNVSYPILDIDREIRSLNLTFNAPGFISDENVIQLFYKSLSILDEYDLGLETQLTQVYRRNSLDLNCKRHMGIFNDFNVIPQYCFGCYKVQVEPKSIIELIKLIFVFDHMQLDNNNTRKCMTEMRPEITGFYKGLIYCSNLEEAFEIADYLDVLTKEKVGPGLNVAVKRGCSEYALSYPDYKKIDRSGTQLMNYNKDWDVIENEYDLENRIESETVTTPTISGVGLADVLIMRNWVDYAKGIGDIHAELLEQKSIVNQNIYRTSQIRVKTHPFKEPM